MPLKIILADITTLKVDAIVNAANTSLLGGGGVDGSIHRAAGPDLLEECKTLGGCKIGQAKLTGAYRLSAKYIIHTVGPRWRDGNSNEEEFLASCYTSSLSLAQQYGVESIAFPLISAGAYGYPKDKALQVAVSVISDFVRYNDLMVYLVIYNKSDFVLSEQLFVSVMHYIDANYEKPDSAFSPGFSNSAPDETFSHALSRLIEQKSLSAHDLPNKANIPHELFTKITAQNDFAPTKPTVLALAVALRLPLEQTKELLRAAGFALSNASKFDLIATYFIQGGNFNIFEINQVLFAFDQEQLGGERVSSAEG